MSCPLAKQDRSRAKDLRQGIKSDAEPRPRKSKKRISDKPVTVSFASNFMGLQFTRKFESVEAAEKWIAKERRSYNGGFGRDYSIEKPNKKEDV